MTLYCPNSYNFEFYGLYIQTGIGIGCHHLIPTENIMHIQTTDLELVV